MNISERIPKIEIRNFLPNQGFAVQRNKILRGLTGRNKYISSIFFYDDTGSKLFEQITRLPEYYPPRKEMLLLKKITSLIKNELKDIDIVELGSGDCSKISILLKSVPPHFRKTIRYLPFDVSMGTIEKSAKTLVKKFPYITILGIVADFHTQLHLIPRERKRIFCFFGSTIGNFTPPKAEEFISNLNNIMNPGEMLLLSFDLVKEKDILEKAYNDSQKITAKFNRNILNVANRYAKTNFDPQDFQHLAFYNPQCSRIEMHLKAKRDITINSPYLNQSSIINKGETIHTEYSHKFALNTIQALVEGSQLTIQNIFTDKKKWFAVSQLIKQ